MKKIFFIPVTVLLLILCFTSCNRYNEADFLCDCGKIEIDKKEYIAMCISSKEVTANSVNYWRSENHTKQNMCCNSGIQFALDYFDSDHWKSIQINIPINSLPWYVNAGQILEEKIDLYSLVEQYNNAKKGKYRIGKNIQLGDETNQYDLVAEFEVK
jgi:hypothetical protein